VNDKERSCLDLSVPQKIRDLLSPEGCIKEPQRSIAEFVETAANIYSSWQERDWRIKDEDRQRVLNNSTLVDQVWFRGHGDCTASLQPGLYRDGTIIYIKKDPTQLHSAEWADQFSELINLEHELRIDFMSYGHLLNVPGKVIEEVDWYFLMQHHRLPTRLLDWTTNALAAAFFAWDGTQQLQRSGSATREPILPDLKDHAGIWMIDAYWLADRLSDSWYSPMLPDSKDAARYIPPIQSWIEDESASGALIPSAPMPIEPTAIHPRVAVQEGKFIIFGSERELLDQELILHPSDMKEKDPLRVVLIPLETSNLEGHFEGLARLGISRRTLFPDFDGLSDFLRWKHFHRVPPFA
jgi:FRG domain-containing protein